MENIIGRVLNAVNGEQSQILENLWLGSEKYDCEWIDTTGINVIINCTKDIPFKCTHVEQIRVPIDDHPSNKPLLDALAPHVIYTMNERLRGGKKIYVHCRAGVQRSASVVVRYLSQYMSLEDSLNYVKEKRPIVFMNGYRLI